MLLSLYRIIILWLWMWAVIEASKKTWQRLPKRVALINANLSNIKKINIHNIYLIILLLQSNYKLYCYFMIAEYINFK